MGRFGNYTYCCNKLRLHCLYQWVDSATGGAFGNGVNALFPQSQKWWFLIRLDTCLSQDIRTPSRWLFLEGRARGRVVFATIGSCQLILDLARTRLIPSSRRNLSPFMCDSPPVYRTGRSLMCGRPLEAYAAGKIQLEEPDVHSRGIRYAPSFRVGFAAESRNQKPYTSGTIAGKLSTVPSGRPGTTTNSPCLVPAPLVPEPPVHPGADRPGPKPGPVPLLPGSHPRYRQPRCRHTPEPDRICPSSSAPAPASLHRQPVPGAARWPH